MTIMPIPTLNVTPTLKLNLPCRARRYHLFDIEREIKYEYMDGRYLEFLLLNNLSL